MLDVSQLKEIKVHQCISIMFFRRWDIVLSGVIGDGVESQIFPLKVISIRIILLCKRPKQ
mgnify:CR=1 FL=1